MTYKIKHKTLPFRGTKSPLSVVSSVEFIMLRIRAATQESPIAVFLKKSPFANKGPGLVAVFGSTIETKKIAVEENPDFIGMYHKRDHLSVVESTLTRALVV